MDEKEKIPTIWIEDPNFFIIAYYEKPAKQAKIIATIKYRQLCVSLEEWKGKMVMVVKTKYWDGKMARTLPKTHSMRVRYIEETIPLLREYRNLAIEKELTFVTATVKDSEEQMPAYNLL